MAKNLLKEVMIKHEEVLKIRKAVGSKSTKESSDLVKKIESGYVVCSTDYSFNIRQRLMINVVA